MNNFGICYRGSKSRIAADLIAHLPAGGTFYDLFAGGCAVTHAAMLSGKYRRFVANDITGTPGLFRDAIAGKFRDEKRWISREDFFRLKDSEPYVRCVWSFGANGKDYCYSQTIEPYKRACHYAIVLDDFRPLAELCPEVVEAVQTALSGVWDRTRRRLIFGRTVLNWLKRNGTEEMLANNPLYASCHFKGGKANVSPNKIQRLESLESLERLQSLESLQCLQSLAAYAADYRDIPIDTSDNPIVYCDPPYRGTSGYGFEFDFAAFDEWLRTRPFPVYISEYTMPEDFVPIWGATVQQLASAKGGGTAQERLWVHRKWRDEIFTGTLF
jgi:hypothetical protein